MPLRTLVGEVPLRSLVEEVPLRPPVGNVPLRILVSELAEVGLVLDFNRRAFSVKILAPVPGGKGTDGFLDNLGGGRLNPPAGGELPMDPKLEPEGTGDSIPFSAPTGGDSMGEGELTRGRIKKVEEDGALAVFDVVPTAPDPGGLADAEPEVELD